MIHDKDIIEMIRRLERNVGSSCVNNKGYMIRYPYHGTDLNMYYRFGANTLEIGLALVKILNKLQCEYGIDFNKLEEEKYEKAVKFFMDTPKSEYNTPKKLGELCYQYGFSTQQKKYAFEKLGLNWNILCKDAVEEKRGLGYPENTIKAILKKEGHIQERIDSVFENINFDESVAIRKKTEYYLNNTNKGIIEIKRELICDGFDKDLCEIVINEMDIDETKQCVSRINKLIDEYNSLYFYREHYRTLLEFIYARLKIDFDERVIDEAIDNPEIDWESIGLKYLKYEKSINIDEVHGSPSLLWWELNEVLPESKIANVIAKIKTLTQEEKWIKRFYESQINYFASYDFEKLRDELINEYEFSEGIVDHFIGTLKKKGKRKQQ